MIDNDKQRRWWFANHPEYSSSYTGAKQQAKHAEDDQGDKVSPQEVDDYVNYATPNTLTDRLLNSCN